jgi:hypothetical protein
MKKDRIAILVMAWLALAGGCGPQPKPYGEEQQLFLPGAHKQVWAVAPTINISGQSPIDPLLQSDLVYQEMQQIHGLTVIPVDRVVEAYASLRINKIESEREADMVCQILGCDALVIPTITEYDPYDPPKFGASLQLFMKPGAFGTVPLLDPRQLERSPTSENVTPMPGPRNMAQVVSVYDASDGTVLDRVENYAKGRIDPNAPLGARQIVISMDRYCSFCYHELLVELLGELAPPDNAAQASAHG